MKRTCLKCDKLFETTPEFRLCPPCKANIRDSGADTGYEIASNAGNRHLMALPALG